MLPVTGTTVTTPRPSRSAVSFARSLLAITAGRRSLACCRVLDYRSRLSKHPTTAAASCLCWPSSGPEPAVPRHSPGQVVTNCISGAGCIAISDHFVLAVLTYLPVSPC